MKFRTEDEPDLTIPEDSIVRARLNEIKLRTFEWTDRKTNEQKSGEALEWWWEITSNALGSQYVGRKVKGQCNPKITNRDGNRFRMWSEALLQREIPVGMEIDTDDLVGLEAEIVVGHKPDKKDPGKVWEEVTDVAPLSDGSYDEPPF
jgi:hypothetical protein